MERGKKQLQKHQYERAILEFRNALEAKPKSPEAYYQSALAYLGEKDITSAARALRRALEFDPKYTAAELKISELALATRNPASLPEAERRLQQLMATSAADPEAFNTFAIAEWRLGKHEDAEKVLTQAVAHFPGDLDSAANLARFKLSQGDRAGAEAILKNAAEAAPDSAGIALILGRFFSALGREQDAEQQFRRALNINANFGPALISLAELQSRIGHNDEADRLYKKAASLADPQYKPVHALFLFRSGKRDLALAEFQALAKADPSDRDARSRLIAAYQAANKSVEAEKLLSEALKKNPQDVDALLQRSGVFLRDGKYAQAQADLATVIHFQPDSATAHYLLGKVYQKTGATLRSRQEFTEAIRVNPGLLAARLELAQLLIADNSSKAALDTLDEASQAQKSEFSVLLARNWAYLGLRDWVEARKGIDRAMQLDANNSQPLVQDGTLKLTQRKFAAARESFEAALKRDPDDYKTLDLLVQAYNYDNQMPAAVERVRQYAAHRPNSAPVQFFCGQLMSRMGNRDEARKAFAAAKAADPGLNAADISLAGLDIAEEKWDDAQKRVAGLLAQAPGDTQVRLTMSAIEDHLKNRAAAIQQLREIIQADDSNIKALNNLAYLLAESSEGHYDEALKFAQRAQELAPDDPTVQDTIGWVLYRKGLYSLAVPYLERSVASQPTGTRKYHLGTVYLKLGNQRRGSEMIAAALKLDPALSNSGLQQELNGETTTKAR
jgi:tetratricopeptide (TPR) repeat protein